MRSASIRSTILVLFVGVALGLAAGYLVGRALAQSPAASAPNHSAELAQLRAEVDELKSQMAPASVDEQVTQLQGMVADILLRGDEFSLRADYARTADRLDGHKPSDFALRDADGDGTDDLEQVKQTLAAIVSGATPVGKAKKADSAGNAEFLGNLALTDFAVANHSHAKLGDVRVDGALSVTGKHDRLGRHAGFRRGGGRGRTDAWFSQHGSQAGHCGPDSLQPPHGSAGILRRDPMERDCGGKPAVTQSDAMFTASGSGA